MGARPQPVHLFQVLPAGPLARRTFPPLRLERAWEVAEDDASEAVSGQGGRRVGPADPGFGERWLSFRN